VSRVVPLPPEAVDNKRPWFAWEWSTHKDPQSLLLSTTSQSWAIAYRLNISPHSGAVWKGFGSLSLCTALSKLYQNVWVFALKGYGLWTIRELWVMGLISLQTKSVTPNLLNGQALCAPRPSLGVHPDAPRVCFSESQQSTE